MIAQFSLTKVFLVILFFFFLLALLLVMMYKILPIKSWPNSVTGPARTCVLCVTLYSEDPLNINLRLENMTTLCLQNQTAVIRACAEKEVTNKSILKCELKVMRIFISVH